jgi:hypothetical protein
MKTHLISSGSENPVINCYLLEWKSWGLMAVSRKLLPKVSSALVDE